MTTETATLRVPPHNKEAEQSVLGGLLLDNTAWDRVGDLLVEADFYRHEHKLIFTAIGSLLNASKPADILTVLDQLQRVGKLDDAGGVGYLNELVQSVPSASNARRYAEIIRERAIERGLIAACDEASALAFSRAVPAGEAIERAVTAIERVGSRQMRSAPVSIQDLVVRQLDHYSDLTEGATPPGWPTHIGALNEALNGGLRPGKVYVLAARPSVGKSSFAAQLGLHRARAGHGVLILSQEMESSEVTDRMVCCLGGVDYGRMQTGKFEQEDWTNVCEATELIRDLPLWIDDQPALTLSDIRAKAGSLRRHGLKVLVIDYLQLCASGEKKDNRNAEVEELSRGIKALAKQLGLAVVLLSQLNRAVEKRGSPEPNLADLRDSGAIEQDADVVMFLWPVRQFTERSIVGMKLGKNRQGKAGVRIPLEFQGQFQRWWDSEADLDPPTFKSKEKEFE